MPLTKRTSMPATFHYYIRRFASLLALMMVLSYVKLRILSDPADVDQKKDLIKQKDSHNRDAPPTDAKLDPTPAPTSLRKAGAGEPDSTPAPTPKPRQSPTEPPVPKRKPITNATAAFKDIQQTTFASSILKREQDLFFADTSCQLESADWLPSRPEQLWQQRTPSVILAGALESGVPSIARRLMEHSQFHENRQHSPEVNFFLPAHFRPFLTKFGLPKVWSARNQMYAKDYLAKEMRKDLQKHALDASTSYLFRSTSSPLYIACVAPWAKVVLVLRNPVDRLVAQYQASVKLGMKESIDDWINDDILLLEEAGIGSDKKIEEAWSEYLSLAGAGPVGRGLYALQLLYDWLAVIQKAHGDVSNRILIVRYEDWKHHPKQVWLKISDFIDLPDDDKVKLPSPTSLTKSNLLGDKMRGKLKKFYQPYNKQVYDLLGWQDVWD